MTYIFSSLTIFWIVFRFIVISTEASLFGLRLDEGHLYLSWYASGLPFISMGMSLKKKQILLRKIPLIAVVIILISSFLLMLGEQFLLFKLFGREMDYYFGSIGCVITIFALSLQKPLLFSKIKILSSKGNWTAFVYIFHQAVIIGVTNMFTKYDISGDVINWTKPLIVLAITLVTSWAAALLLEGIKYLLSLTKATKSSSS